MSTMTIRRYFKPVDSLPGASGSLAASVPPSAIANANKEVSRVLMQLDDQQQVGCLPLAPLQYTVASSV